MGIEPVIGLGRHFIEELRIGVDHVTPRDVFQLRELVGQLRQGTLGWMVGGLDRGNGLGGRPVGGVLDW